MDARISSDNRLYRKQKFFRLDRHAAMQSHQTIPLSIQSLKNDCLLTLIEKAIVDQPDIEKATEAYDELIRRDRAKVVRKARMIFTNSKIRPIPWLATARKSLEILELPPPGQYQGHLYVVLVGGFTEQSQFYGAYVGSSRYTPETRFKQHKRGQNASKLVKNRGLQVLRSLCWPDGRTVPGGKEIIFWESALNRCLARVIPKVRGDFRPMEEWEEGFQKPLCEAYES